ncbi:MAG TPA: hypothetical protein VF008_09805 [Niastella sp.]
MNHFKVYAYRIPDVYFLPHKVTSPFHAKVVYSIDGGKAKIEEVGFHPDTLQYIAGMSQMKVDIQKKLDVVVGNNQVNETIMSAIAPHI